ncbi:hypothetical protein GUJ93_ZPchr0010g10361 [Zizania palustris]|uniref:RING-type E3 ubiquitin transferase n=1 Tax=Zizania palustris TaxID=103762 RepID=A0A8J5WDN4_ZIZPA|nr:hypothetical protein GUJ93_ZPchr0010g10361 [Zizania palustris]
MTSPTRFRFPFLIPDSTRGKVHPKNIPLHGSTPAATQRAPPPAKLLFRSSAPPPPPSAAADYGRFLDHAVAGCVRHQQNLEEREPLSSGLDGSSLASAIDKKLDTSTPDTYKAPPAPLPYDVGLVVTDNPELEKSGIKRKIDDQQETLMMDENESLKKGVPEDKPNEEDVCPICLEEYDEENPRSTTKCKHHFHLCCILEWMERSGTCPICDQTTLIDEMYE